MTEGARVCSNGNCQECALLMQKWNRSRAWPAAGKEASFLEGGRERKRGQGGAGGRVGSP